MALYKYFSFGSLLLLVVFLTSWQGDGDHTRVSKIQDPSKGQGQYSIEGTLNKEFQSKTYYNDTSGIKAFGKREFSNLLSLGTRFKGPEKTLALVVYIYNENTNSPISDGNYAIKNLTGSNLGAFAFLTVSGETNRTFATTMANEKTGTISLKSRQGKGMKGRLNNLKLAQSRNDDNTIVINGDFFAKAR